MKADDIEDFEEILEQAEDNASSEWEMQFTNGIRYRYVQFGGSALISEKQLSILERLSGSLL